MKKIPLLLLISFCCLGVFAQKTIVQTKSDLQKMVATEVEFAKTAFDKGTKTAFLTYLDDDGIIFDPTETNGKLVWRSRPESPALLAWNPVWADISSDGKLGYTTGGWEYRPKGKTDKPIAFGEYVTIWKKQTDGSYKATLDIGITHPTNNLSKMAWKSPFDAGLGKKDLQNGVDTNILTDIFSNKSMANGYFNYLAEDTIILRDGNLPFVGKKAAFMGLEKLENEFPNSSYLTFNGNTSKIYGNMMYIWGVYQLKHKDETISRWNFMQIWKHRDGKWQIVLDIFNPIPQEKK
jgi:ketosteroid isomerase-like protein